MNNRFGIYPYMYVLMLGYSTVYFFYVSGLSLSSSFAFGAVLVWSAVFALMMMFPVWLIKVVASHKNMTIMKTAFLGGLVFSFTHLLSGWSGFLSNLQLGDPKIMAATLSTGIISAVLSFVFGVTVGATVGTLLSIRVRSGLLKSQKP